MEKQYKRVGKMFFDIRTPDVVCNILECYNSANRNSRIRLFYGDTDTGKCWMEENDTLGYVGRSTGSIQIPLLIHNKNSKGGSAILDHCIVKITDGKRIVYRHPNYHMPVVSVSGKSVFADGANVANFDNEQKAAKWAAFIKGERNNWN